MHVTRLTQVYLLIFSRIYFQPPSIIFFRSLSHHTLFYPSHTLSLVMFTPARLVVLLTAALSVVAVPSHFARNVHNHREIAARVPQVATAKQVLARDMSIPVERSLRKKRAGTGRCKPKNTSTVQDDPKPTTTTPKDDPKPSTDSPEPTPTPKPSPTPTPTPDPAPTPDPTPTPDPGNGGGDGGGQTYTGQGV